MKVYKVRDISKEVSKPWRLFAAYDSAEAIAEARIEDSNPTGRYEVERYELYSRAKKVSKKYAAHFEDKDVDNTE